MKVELHSELESTDRSPGEDFAPRYGVAAIGKAFDLLDALDARGIASLTELGAAAGVHKSTALRILANLEKRRYVDRDTRGMYRLGVRLIQLGAHASASIDLRAIARPVLDALHDQLEETVNLAVPTDTGITYIDIFQTDRGLRMAAVVGMQDDFHTSALGKAVLAWMPMADVHRLVGSGPLKRRTERTIVDLEELFVELATVRQQGYAVDDEENEPGARCVGAPLVDMSGRCVGAVSVSAPITRLPSEQISVVGARVAAAAAAISIGLGHQADAPSADHPERQL